MAIAELLPDFIMVGKLKYLTVTQAIKYCDNRRESAILTWVRKWHPEGLRKVGPALMIAEWVLIEYKNSMRK